MPLSRIEIATVAHNNPLVTASMGHDAISLFVDKVHHAHDNLTSDVYLQFSDDTIQNVMKTGEYLNIIKMKMHNSDIFSNSFTHTVGHLRRNSTQGQELFEQINKRTLVDSTDQDIMMADDDVMDYSPTKRS